MVYKKKRHVKAYRERRISSCRRSSQQFGRLDKRWFSWSRIYHPRRPQIQFLPGNPCQDTTENERVHTYHRVVTSGFGHCEEVHKSFAYVNDIIRSPTEEETVKVRAARTSKRVKDPMMTVKLVEGDGVWPSRFPLGDSL